MSAKKTAHCNAVSVLFVTRAADKPETSVIRLLPRLNRWPKLLLFYFYFKKIVYHQCETDPSVASVLFVARAATKTDISQI